MQFSSFFPCTIIRACGFDHASGTLSVRTTAMASRSKECEGAVTDIPRVLDKAAFVVLLDEWHRLQPLLDFQKIEDVASVEALLQVLCAIKQDDGPFVELEALKLSNLAKR